MLKKVKSGKTKYALADTAEKAKKLVTVSGLSEASAEGTTHTFAEEEKVSCACMAASWLLTRHQLHASGGTKH